MERWRMDGIRMEAIKKNNQIMEIRNMNEIKK